MAETPMDSRTLVRRTLVTVGAMVGACAVVVGSLALVAEGIAGRLAGGGDSTEKAVAVNAPAAAVAPAGVAIPRHAMTRTPVLLSPNARQPATARKK